MRTTDRTGPDRLRRSWPIFGPIVVISLTAQGWWARGSGPRADQLLQRFGLRWDDLGQPRQWFRLLTSPYAQPDADLSVSLVALMVMLVSAERRLGTRRTIITFVTTDVLSTLAVFTAMRLAEYAGGPGASIIHVRDGGASSGTIGVVVAYISALDQQLVRWVATVALGLTLLRGVLWFDELADRQHLVAALVGVGLVALHQHRLSQQNSAR